MKLLALDAATDNCSVALLCGGECTERNAMGGKAHSQLLLDMIAGVMAEGQLALTSLDGIVASVGPGAFTGVRIGIAVAQGLAFGAGLRIAAVSTLEALALRALAAARESQILACLDARMHEVYWGCYAGDAGRGLLVTRAPRVGAPSSVDPPFGCEGIGRGFDAYPALAAIPGVHLPTGAAAALPRAREFARLGARRFELGLHEDPADLRPLYLRDKVALTEAERISPPDVI